MLSGLNHLTLAVSQLPPSVAFYQHLLGFTLHAQWRRGAYLSLGPLWLCLTLDAGAAPRLPGTGYTHYAFSIGQADFAPFVARLRAASVAEWNSNRSEGDSFYFLDPDRHLLEAHVGSLASRLAACRTAPYDGMVFFGQDHGVD